MKDAQAGGLRILEDWKDYFLAGVVWWVGCAVPERTEWSPPARDNRIVRPMEVSMKTIAE